MKKKVNRFDLHGIFAVIILVGVVAFIGFHAFSSTGKVIETPAGFEKTTSYIYGNGLVASYDSNGEEKFYINDHLGGTSVVLDKNGNKISEESYYAFGEEKSSTGDERLTYTGKEKDDSGLYYYGARYYDADSGRFIQPDPLSGEISNPQSLNKYVYVLNNPNKYVDPSGMEEKPTMLAYSASPEADWNGAFNNRPEKFKSGFNVISTETSSFSGITDFVAEEMVKGNIPDVIYIGFHGSPKTMGSLRVVESGTEITNYDKELIDLGRILPASTTIVLESCSTGAECGGYNIAKAVNALTGKRVIAPTEASSVGDIYVDNNGKIQAENIVHFHFESIETNLKQKDLPWRVALDYFFSGGAISQRWSYQTKPDTTFNDPSRTISYNSYSFTGSNANFIKNDVKITEENLYKEFK